MSHNLTDLPFELLLEIHFLATSSALPVTNRHFQSTFRNVTNQYKARWLFRLTAAEKSLKSTKAKLQVITDALTYPLCNLPVFCILFTLLYPKDPRPDPDDGASLIKKSSKRRVKLPRRLFKIPPKVNKFKIPEDHMRLLRFLLESTLAHPDSHDGYGLARAVFSKQPELIDLLLFQGADPQANGWVAMVFAIKQKDLKLVMRLFQHARQPIPSDTSKLLEVAAKSKAWPIFDYLKSQGAVPTMATALLLQQHGH